MSSDYGAKGKPDGSACREIDSVRVGVRAVSENQAVERHDLSLLAPLNCIRIQSGKSREVGAALFFECINRFDCFSSMLEAN